MKREDIGFYMLLTPAVLVALSMLISMMLKANWAGRLVLGLAVSWIATAIWLMEKPR